MTIERICLFCHKPQKKTKVKVKTVCYGHPELEPCPDDADIVTA
jgi:hypothetical protein